MAPLKTSISIPAKQARMRFGEILDKSYYNGDQFLIIKKKTPVAIIVGVRAWEKMQNAQNAKSPLPRFTSSDLGKMKISLIRENMYE